MITGFTNLQVLLFNSFKGQMSNMCKYVAAIIRLTTQNKHMSALNLGSEMETGVKLVLTGS